MLKPLAHLLRDSSMLAATCQTVIKNALPSKWLQVLCKLKAQPGLDMAADACLSAAVPARCAVLLPGAAHASSTCQPFWAARACAGMQDAFDCTSRRRVIAYSNNAQPLDPQSTHYFWHYCSLEQLLIHRQQQVAEALKRSPRSR